jgi:hypothetical protein
MHSFPAIFFLAQTNKTNKLMVVFCFFCTCKIKPAQEPAHHLWVAYAWNTSIYLGTTHGWSRKPWQWLLPYECVDVHDSTSPRLCAVSHGMKLLCISSYTKQKWEESNAQEWLATHSQVSKRPLSISTPRPPYEAHARLEESCWVISGHDNCNEHDVYCGRRPHVLAGFCQNKTVSVVHNFYSHVGDNCCMSSVMVHCFTLSVMKIILFLAHKSISGCAAWELVRILVLFYEDSITHVKSFPVACEWWQ